MSFAIWKKWLEIIQPDLDLDAPIDPTYRKPLASPAPPPPKGYPSMACVMTPVSRTVNPLIGYRGIVACGRCRFWNRNEDEQNREGDCRKCPPVAPKNWPVTLNSDWCAHFEPLNPKWEPPPPSE